ncbi:MAG: hypothetical protein AB3N12_03555 [Ruegeria sp.]
MAKEEREADETVSSSSSDAGAPATEIPPLAEGPPTDKDALQEAISVSRRAAGPPLVEAESAAPLDDAQNEEHESDPA